MIRTGERVPPELLRELFLFESLDPERLALLSELGDTCRFEPGETVYADGDPADTFYVLLSGTLQLTRRVEGVDVETVRNSSRGVYAGATRAFVSTDPQVYQGGLRAVTDLELWCVDAAALARLVREWFPMAMHLYEGMVTGMQNSRTVIDQRARLLALGRLSAGLTHELNNPAAAAVRATATLRERVAKMRHKLAMLAERRLDPELLRILTELQDDAVESLAKAPDLTSLEEGDRTDELTDWMDDHGIDGGWDLAPTLVAAGLRADWLDRLEESLPDAVLADGLRWVAYALETEQLMGEIEDSTSRIMSLVGAAKQYTSLDRAPLQDVDVHEGLKSTLVMMRSKLDRVELVKDLDRSLPRIPAYPAELNQVWTNLIDNAVAAMPDGGTLSLRSFLDHDHVVVIVGDTGSGIPPELQGRVFEPFFTTKPVGEGTGLGLDISYRVVTQRHGGDLRLRSEPGRTELEVRLPLVSPPSLD